MCLDSGMNCLIETENNLSRTKKELRRWNPVWVHVARTQRSVKFVTSSGARFPFVFLNHSSKNTGKQDAKNCDLRESTSRTLTRAGGRVQEIFFFSSGEGFAGSYTNIEPAVMADVNGAIGIYVNRSADAWGLCCNGTVLLVLDGMESFWGSNTFLLYFTGFKTLLPCS